LHDVLRKEKKGKETQIPKRKRETNPRSSKDEKLD